MIFKRKNWEAEKLKKKYLIQLAGSNFIPYFGIIYPLYLTFKLISELHRIYIGQPLFGSIFFDSLKIKNINNEQIKRLLIKLWQKTGLKLFLRISVKTIGVKFVIKIGLQFLNIFPLAGELIKGIIGNLMDIPNFYDSFNVTKEELINLLRQRPHEVIRRIVVDYNDSINYFGKRAGEDINQINYDIPNENVNDNNFDLLNGLDINELLIVQQENNV